MTDYLPEIYLRFRAAYPAVADALDGLGRASEAAGSLDDHTQRLVKLGIAVGAEAEGAVRSNVRKALQLGIAPDDIRQVALLAITTTGFPSCIAGLAWIEEVLAAGG